MDPCEGRGGSNGRMCVPVARMLRCSAVARALQEVTCSFTVRPSPRHPADASPADASPADASPADASPADASPADASPADPAPPTPTPTPVPAAPGSPLDVAASRRTRASVSAGEDPTMWDEPITGIRHAMPSRRIFSMGAPDSDRIDLWRPRSTALNPVAGTNARSQQSTPRAKVPGRPHPPPSRHWVFLRRRASRRPTGNGQVAVSVPDPGELSVLVESYVFECADGQGGVPVTQTAPDRSATVTGPDERNRIHMQGVREERSRPEPGLSRLRHVQALQSLWDCYPLRRLDRTASSRPCSPCCCLWLLVEWLRPRRWVTAVLDDGDTDAARMGAPAIGSPHRPGQCGVRHAWDRRPSAPIKVHDLRGDRSN